jgi:HAD superfamily phosphatase (TIGR01668 family)
MMERLRPDIYKNKISDIDFEHLKKNGIKVLLIDMDNTILKYKEKNIDEEAKCMIENLKKDFQILLFSNASKRRVKQMSETISIPYVSLAFKPCKRKFFKVFKEYKVEPCEVAIIGDQLLTDVKGGNKAGITTILVSPLSEDENFFTRVNRRREKKIFKKMGAKGLFFKERYYE